MINPCRRAPARILRALALALGFGALPAGAAVPEGVDVRAVLDGPQTVQTKNGRTYTGEITGLRDGRLGVLVFDGGGEVEYSVPADDIASVRFPGETIAEIALDMYENDEYEEALPLLEAVYRQRAACLPFLSDDQAKPVAALPRVYRETGDDIEAIATARRLLKDLGAGAHRGDLEALILDGYLRLELYERAAEQARDWCARRGRYPESALGWTVLAEIALREERYEDALWIALQPVAFSGARSIAHLDRAYAAAIHACRMLEDDEYGLLLFAEARERRLPWPDDAPGHPETFAFYRDRAAAELGDENAGDDGTAPALDPRPAREDLNLPLYDVRRLLLALPED